MREQSLRILLTILLICRWSNVLLVSAFVPSPPLVLSTSSSLSQAPICYQRTPFIVSVDKTNRVVFKNSQYTRQSPLHLIESKNNKRRHFATRLYATPEPLQTEGDWSAYLDEDNTGLIYYFNGQTGEAKWEPPTKTFPPVVLSRKVRRRAEAKQQEYLETAAAMEREQREKAQQLVEVTQSNIAVTAEKEQTSNDYSSNESRSKTATATATTTGDSNWFDFLSPDKSAATTTSSSTTTATDAAKKKRKEEVNWFESIFSGGSKKQSRSQTVDYEEESIPQPKEEQIFQNTSTATTTVEPETKPSTTTTSAPAKTKDQSSKFPIFNSLFNRDKTKNGSATATSTSSSSDDSYTETDDTETYTEEPATTVTTTKPKPAHAIRLDMAAYVLPHPAKASWGGEDAVFTQGRTFGVFDGVSGANKLDGVPLYSKTMALEMKKMIGSDTNANNFNSNNNVGLTTQEMINYLTRAAITCDSESTGATTAIVASISEDGFLRALNLGDSSCIIVRNNNSVVARTKEISHYFDCPYQLSIDSPDRPRDGTKLNIELVEGDIVVMASDGIFDNLSDDDIIKVIQDSPPRAQAIAKRLSDQSRKVSLNRKAATPYAQSAKKYGDPDYESGLGGKVDDISCVVVRYV